MPPQDDNTNGRVTLAIIKRDLEELQKSTEALTQTVQAMHDNCIISAEFRKVVTYQLWDKDQKSRIEQAENKIESLEKTRASIFAVAMALVVPAILGVYSTLKSMWLYFVTSGGNKP